MENEAKVSLYKRQAEYLRRNKHKFRVIGIRFNVEKDADILDSLPEKNVSTRIKQLLRLALQMENDFE